MLLLQSSFKLQLGFCAVFSRMSNRAGFSVTPSREEYTEQGPGLCFHKYGACSFSPIIEQSVNPKVWADGNLWFEHKMLFLYLSSSKHPHLFPHQKQYPLKLEVKEGLKSIIKNSKKQELLIPYNSPCNTPILGIKMSNDKWVLVQNI